MIEETWRRIGGVHCKDDGEIAAVWLAHDKQTDCVHLYDACMFRREVLAVIAEGISCRGRWIPVSWEEKSKDVADKLTDRGCNMLPEGTKDTDTMAEVLSRDIWERMRSGRFKVDKRLSEWLDEFKSFNRKEADIPRDSHPLMAATRHAMAQIVYARRQLRRGVKGHHYPRVAIV